MEPEDISPNALSNLGKIGAPIRAIESIKMWLDNSENSSAVAAHIAQSATTQYVKNEGSTIGAGLAVGGLVAAELIAGTTLAALALPALAVGGGIVGMVGVISFFTSYKKCQELNPEQRKYLANHADQIGRSIADELKGALY